MAINHVRNLIVNSIEDESLKSFHKACATTDRLFRIMEDEQDPDKAYAMAVAWATSLLNLARVEVRLLSAVLPLYQDELDELVSKISPLIQRREDARMAVHEFRGPDHDVRPLSMKTDPNRAKDIADARENAKQVSIEVLAKMRPMQDDAEELQRGIGAINRTLRALDVFVQRKFPTPTRKPSLRGQSAVPSGEDPIAVWAKNYVATMDSRDRVNARTEALRAARKHPINKYDWRGQELVH